MEQEQKIKYLTIALNICNVAFSEQQTDLIIRLYEMVCEKGAGVNMEDIAGVQSENQRVYDNKLPF